MDLRRRQGLSAWLERGIYVGRVSRIPVYLHPLLALMILMQLTGAAGRGGADAVAFEAITEATLLLGILLHELGHCHGARLMGGEAGSILLWPLGGLAFTSDGVRSPYNEFVVVVWGPLVSLALALGGWLALKLCPATVVGMAGGAYFLHFLACVAVINSALFVFNVFVPLFPMDAARLLRSWFSMRLDAGRVTYNVCLLGLFTAGILAAGFIYELVAPRLMPQGESFWLLIIAVMGVAACATEMRRIQHEEVYPSPNLNRLTYESWMRRARRRLRFLAPRPARREPIPVPIRPPAKSAAAPAGLGKGTSAGARPSDPDAPPPDGGNSGGARIVEISAELDGLDEQLRRAIKAEDFASAARLRDRIKQFKAARAGSKNAGKK